MMEYTSEAVEALTTTVGKLLRQSKPKRLLSNQNLSWKASVHDQSQLELNFDYATRKDPERAQESQPLYQHYELNFYFFTPKHLDIGPSSYPEQQFLQHLKNFVRLHTPEYTFCRTIQFPFTEQYFKLGVKVAKRQALSQAVIQEIKLFGNYINLQIKKSWHLLEKQNDQSCTQGVLKVLSELQLLMQNFRDKYLGPIRQNPSVFDREVRQAFFSVDEYISNRYVSFCLQAAPLYHEAVANHLEVEKQYRKQHFENFELLTSATHRERFYYHFGHLKKFVSEAVYLKLEQQKSNNYYKNIFAAIAAALAALWANLARFGQDNGQLHGIYGLDFIFMLLLGIIAYVFKDRIKDWSKEYFNQKIKLKTPYAETKMSYTHFSPEGVATPLPVGQYQEFIKYIWSQELPEEVAYVQEVSQRQLLTHPTNDRILHYTKRIALDPKAPCKLKLEQVAFKDIFRLDIGDFLSRMDDASKSLSVYDEDQGATIINAPKTYYFDLILQLKSLPDAPLKKSKRHEAQGQTQTSIDCLRLVLNKNGLVRIDGPVEKAKFSFQTGQSKVEQ